MPLNKPDQTTSAMPGHVASTDQLGAAVDGRAIARMLDFEKRRCYVCGTRADEGCCGGVDGELSECPWY